MSVAIGTPMRLPEHPRPPVFGGSGADQLFTIAVSEIGRVLRLREDPDVPSGHGFVEPVRRRTFDEYQEAIWATRSSWRRVES